MTEPERLAEFLRTGRLGMLAVGAPYAGVRAVIGTTDTVIDDPDPVYRYAGVELCVGGATGLIWMLRLEPFDGVLELPAALGLGESLGIPADRGRFVHLLESYGLGYSLGEFHVPGQTDLMVHGSRVLVLCCEDGEVSSLAVAGERPKPPAVQPL